jgi:hypothetical protein
MELEGKLDWENNLNLKLESCLTPACHSDIFAVYCRIRTQLVQGKCLAETDHLGS